MNRKHFTYLLAAPLLFVGACTGIGYETSDFPRLNDDESVISSQGKVDVPNRSSLGEIELDGEEVENIRPDASKVGGEYCDFSKLDAGEGKDDKGGTCLSQPIGEIAEEPVRVTVIEAPTRVKDGQPFDVNILVADKDGPIDLNAFTFDESGKAGTTLHEHPGELDKDGRPLMHCHLGVSTVGVDGLPGAEYDAAFSGVQGFEGEVKATIKGLEPGFYRGDVFCSQPGHLILPTSKANEVQAFDTFDFEVK